LVKETKNNNKKNLRDLFDAEAAGAGLKPAAAGLGLSNDERSFFTACT
jgi:hypothetical protein